MFALYMQVAYPYVAKRLLTDPDPALRERLLQVRPWTDSLGDRYSKAMVKTALHIPESFVDCIKEIL